MPHRSKSYYIDTVKDEDEGDSDDLSEGGAALKMRNLKTGSSKLKNPDRSPPATIDVVTEITFIHNGRCIVSIELQTNSGQRVHEPSSDFLHSQPYLSKQTFRV
jgi:hypothetical protein